MSSILGKQIGPIGYGLLGFFRHQPPIPSEEAIKTLKAALEAGANFWNAGIFYGKPEYNSVHLLRDYFIKYPEDADKVVISVKAGFRNHAPAASPEMVNEDIDTCLKILGGKKFLDLFLMARIDPNVPVEDTVSAIQERVKKGDVGGIMLSEVSSKTIHRAIKVAPVAAVELEFSLYSTEMLENGVAATCAELNLPIIAYSPLGTGFLTGGVKSLEDIPETDYRRRMPRYQPENFDINIKLAEEVQRLAKQKGCTAPQLALGWVLSFSEAKGMPLIVPIPGGTTVARIQENLKAVTLTSEELETLSELLKKLPIVGGRYPKITSHLEYV